jgi:hypothetical protein
MRLPTNFLVVISIARVISALPLEMAVKRAGKAKEDVAIVGPDESSLQFGDGQSQGFEKGFCPTFITQVIADCSFSY